MSKNIFLLKTKTLFLVAMTTFLFLTSTLSAQVFWTEDFTSGGLGWNMNVATGPEDADANIFYISDDEGGGIPPNLGAPSSCGLAGNGNNTLHVTTSATIGTGAGATYFAGGVCVIGICVTTNRRCESPVINCTGKTNISLYFNYLENGDGTLDNATLWYFDGLNWSLLDDMPKTLTGCSGQGLWTSRTVALPASANNNANVKIAFRWVNNDDGIGTDPSFAVDEITASTPSTTSNTITTGALPLSSYCACSNTIFLPFTSTGIFTLANIYTAQLSNASGSFISPVAIGALLSNAYSGGISCTIPCTTPAGSGYRFRIVSSSLSATGTDNGSNITINPATTPTINISAPILTPCANTIVTWIATITGAGTAPVYQWKKNGIIVGINSPTYSSTLITGDIISCQLTSNIPCANPTVVTASVGPFVVNPLPNITVSSAPNPAICLGDAISLFGNGGISYSWSGGITNGVPFTPTATNAYTVTGADANGCTNTSSIAVVVNPGTAIGILTLTSNPSIVSIGVNTIYTATIPASVASSYQLKWYKANTYLATTNSPVNTYNFTPLTMADSVYAYIVPAGCYTPDSIKSNTILVKSTIGLNDLSAPYGFSCYPNPVFDILHIEGSQQDDQLKLTDMTGRIILQQTMTKNSQTISMTSLSEGVYTACFFRNGKQWAVKIVKK